MRGSTTRRDDGTHGHDALYFYSYLDHPCLSEPEPGPSRLQQSVHNVDLGAREDPPHDATMGPIDQSFFPGPEPGLSRDPRLRQVFVMGPDSEPEKGLEWKRSERILTLSWTS